MHNHNFRCPDVYGYHWNNTGVGEDEAQSAVTANLGVFP
jgi:hypothetical protein